MERGSLDAGVLLVAGTCFAPKRRSVGELSAGAGWWVGVRCEPVVECPWVWVFPVWPPR